MTFTEFYNDRIISSLQSYESAGLIDEMSVYDWVVRALKRFGTLNSVLQEEVLTIKNNQATLPQNFIKLKLAVKCTPSKYFVDKVDGGQRGTRQGVIGEIVIHIALLKQQKKRLLKNFIIREIQ